ncbi:PTS fructose transporter subunit IIC [Superficieibacter electus]|uniref:PTS fructose transporter subunit IIC n=1 Tax=Superficieibacter electus TaxID=2022662 RepID=A0A2P5GL76_9ENTR|nr:fructose-specific PTS transporter subunit EIIC [Superficieibacter electus]POP42700.1 PTS fructose transporter subunit IIC [Superficieibacter electus]POP45776.1 PTS fructose transporter subunit IIC [Superficieibacter electus]
MPNKEKFFVAVTGCPTGIAHTFMAEAALKKAAQQAGVGIRVETNGAAGIENTLTDEEIARADAVIIASDKAVEMARFHGKPLVRASVGHGVKKANELVARAISGNEAVYHHEGSIGSAETNTVKSEEESLGRLLYKALMNGVSNMLPFVVAGGVLIAVSFFWGIYSFDPTNAQYNPFAASIFNLGKLSFSMMVPVFTAFIAYSISNRPGFVAGFVGGLIAANVGAGFLGGIIAGFAAGYFMKWVLHVTRSFPRSLEGFKSIFLLPLVGVLVIGLVMTHMGDSIAAINKGMMAWVAGLEHANPLILGIVVGCMSAFDLGGPVNKAAYVTGTMLLAEQGNALFMAGVMTASMVPPLVIAFATVMFKKYFEKEEQAAGLVNFILSATFIAEGAIPFAAKDPLRVIPILMLSSSIGATLTYWFHVAVPAPHGGLIILPLVTHGMLWIASIVCGGLVGGVIYGFYRKRKYLAQAASNAAPLNNSLA